MAAGAPRAGVFFRPNHRAVKQTSHAANSVAPFLLPRRQGRKAPWSPGERPAPGKTHAAGAPEAPACRNPGQPGDKDALAPRRPGGISWACPLIKFLLACPETRLPGGRETRVPNGRRPGDRETGWPGWRMPGDQAARRPGDRDNFRCVIQIKSGIISNLAEKSS